MQTFQESLFAAGAGISLVDSVVMSQSKMLVISQCTGTTVRSYKCSDRFRVHYDGKLQHFKALVIASYDISGGSIEI